MPELVRREWEHLFEPWFANDSSHTEAPQTAAAPDSLFSEASQPLAVRRQDYVRRQSPLSRDLEARGAHVTTELERLVAYAERRHHAVEVSGSPRPPLRDSPWRMPERPPVVHPPTGTIEARHEEAPAWQRQSSNPPGSSLRAVIAFASIALVAAYVVYVQRSAALAMVRATAAERAAAESQQTAEDAVSAAAETAQRAISEALTHAARAERMIEVMAAPDSRRFELWGGAAAPDAVGQALYSRSRGVIVSASDMPRAEAGYVFQVWAATSSGLVSLGLAAPDAQGRLAAAYDLPPGLSGPVRGFVVTHEQVGGSSVPRGQTALSN